MSEYFDQNEIQPWRGDLGFQQMTLRQKAHFHADSAFGPCVFFKSEGPRQFIFQLPYSERQVLVRFIMNGYDHKFVQVISEKPAKHWPNGVRYMIDVSPITFTIDNDVRLRSTRDVKVEYYDALDFYRYINKGKADIPQVWNIHPFNGILLWKKKVRAGLV